MRPKPDAPAKPQRTRRHPPGSTRRLIALAVLFAGIATLLVAMFRIDLAHAVALIGSAAALGIGYHLLNFLSIPALQAKDPRMRPQGTAQLRDLAFSLSSRKSLIGLRSYRRLAQTAEQCLRLWQQENPGRTPPAPHTLRALADPEHGGQLRQDELLHCLIELEHLNSASSSTHQESGTAP